MEKNIFNFPATSVMSGVNFHTDVSAGGNYNHHYYYNYIKYNNYNHSEQPEQHGVQAGVNFHNNASEYSNYSYNHINNNNCNQQTEKLGVQWGSAQVPSLEQVLANGQSGRGRTFDELGNCSTVLPQQSSALLSTFRSPTGCYRNTNQHGVTTQNHKPLSSGNNPGRGSYDKLQQPLPANWERVVSLEHVFNKTRNQCNTCKYSNNFNNVTRSSDQRSDFSIEEYKGELPADHVVYAQKLKQILNVVDCKECNLMEAKQKARRFEAYQWNVSKKTMAKGACGVYTDFERQAALMFEYSQRVHKFYKMMEQKTCGEWR